ncbi:signal recognition particle protein [Schleiferilactobacillus harbinensis]|uniref:Signal recognition particle protein n=1 Tax=Schleiferilactobacillus harbinensis DSM 16991 TaxID=1122147 RepID=A0A0R1XB73_9LACO|nr:signal recognition particle protein [Schleiferilactobacillus harbinensis]KRM24307.1 Signal recognition particle protein [Schleiferilactobacillus harbinensis DSM 16991]MCI1687761.1 signal recognition particle protein [Schleiferilactobacillus harbinensis]MCI1782292.1 signal recognition particle protein [Schleiferilactobacillus harbinensis]MCI1850159.1 signal recognition particle protein [Schleiferilactobacillus harbinensis]QFR65136.1 signal recognition particle protein [Schleiferilactobacillu
MAFEGLTERLQNAFSKLRRKGKITESDVRDMMREVRLALLEADVNFTVVKDFVNTVRQRALGADVLDSLTPTQQVLKIVNEELTKVMGDTAVPLNKSPHIPTIIMMVGLQGAGKTTTAGKLALKLKNEEHARPLMIAADIYRPAAVDQLVTLGKQIDVPVFEQGTDHDPVDIVKAGLDQAALQKNDYVLIDTAGRLQIDEQLMDELVRIKALAHPDEILLVVDAMTGQNATEVAKGFNDQLDITGVVLTKLDGDTRGGAALSIRAVTGKPIKFTGQGEKLEDLDVFYPDRMANRILGMGDMMTLIEKAQKDYDANQAEKMAEKMRENTFDFNDFLDQMGQIQNMGPVQDLMKMIPGLANNPAAQNLNIGDKDIDHLKAIVYSMTPQEREQPELLNPSRRRRIAAGSGRSVQEVNRMIKQFNMSKEMMQKMSKGNMSGMEGMFGGGVQGKLGQMAMRSMARKTKKNKKKRLKNVKRFKTHK